MAPKSGHSILGGNITSDCYRDVNSFRNLNESAPLALLTGPDQRPEIRSIPPRYGFRTELTSSHSPHPGAHISKS